MQSVAPATPESSPHATPPGAALRASGRHERWVLPAAILVISLALRLPNLTAPILERHDFRQTQTAITVQAWLDRGFDPFHYETPVFGPPWMAPFEFPTFQASVYPLAKAGVPLDLAGRIAALAWFYASAALLGVAVRRFLGETAAIAALAFYVLSPFSILWSRAFLIDYASVALSLGWTLAIASWAARPRVAAAAVGAALGVLAAVTKVTTIAAFLPAVVLLSIAALRRAWRSDAAARAGAAAGLAAMLCIPLAAVAAWTRWADALKAASPAAILTSTSLREWNFGTLEQRVAPEPWQLIVERIPTILPGLFLASLLFALVALRRRSGSARLAVAAALAGILLPVLTFFNLYWRHDYYLIALTPCFALAAGAGVAEILALRIPRRGIVLAVAAAVAFVTGRKAFDYARIAYLDTRRHEILPLARAVELVTPPDRWVVIEGDDWNPRIPYLSHRRAFMLIVGTNVHQIAFRPEVATLVCKECPPEVLGAWPNRRFLGSVGYMSVFHVYPDTAPADATSTPEAPPGGRGPPG